MSPRARTPEASVSNVGKLARSTDPCRRSHGTEIVRIPWNFDGGPVMLRQRSPTVLQARCGGAGWFSASWRAKPSSIAGHRRAVTVQEALWCL